VEISADGAWLAVVADDRSLVLWDGSGRHSSRAGLCGQPVAVGFLAGQHGVLTGTQDGIAEIWPLDAAGPGQGQGARG
jgi:WD40 repeat protein